MKENNDIYKWGSLWNWKSLWHYAGCLAGFIAVMFAIKWLNLEEFLQLPKVASGVAVLLVAYGIEFYQMRISKAKIDLTDLSMALLAIITGSLIL